MTDDVTSEAAVPNDAARVSRFSARGFFPADFAAVESGKIYTSGAFWSNLRFAAYPAVLPSMALVAVIEVPFHANQDNHRIEILMLDADMQPTEFRIEGAFRTAPTIDTNYGEAGTAPLALPITGLKFPRPGSYSFILKIDGDEIARYAVKCVQIANVPNVPPFAGPVME